MLMALGLASCTAKNEQYYRSHPKELQQALKACPNQQPEGLSCDGIKKLAGRMNELAYQLQYSPQGFGHKILALQETIAQQEIEYKKTPDAANLKASLDQNKHDLVEYLAVVKWLESPES